MKKVLAIFGAGPGLSSNVTRHYGGQGFSVALVGRNAQRLAGLAETFSKEGIDTHAFPADLSVEYAASKVAKDIQDKLGRVDVFYYGPVPNHDFAPAQKLTVAMMRPFVDIFFYGLIASVQGVLPGMRERGEGTILAGFGGTAQGGIPGVSGPGPAMNAARNYLQSLQRELVGEGIKVGAMTSSGRIRGSADLERRLAPGGQDHLPKGVVVPTIDPAELLTMLLDAADDPTRLEARWPDVPIIPYLT